MCVTEVCVCVYKHMCVCVQGSRRFVSEHKAACLACVCVHVCVCAPKGLTVISESGKGRPAECYYSLHMNNGT